MHIDYILIIGGNVDQLPFIKLAKKKGFKTIVVDRNNLCKGFKIAVIPNTKPILAILDPITFPITIPEPLFKIAVILTINSGKLVPKATNVIPIIIGEILNLSPINLLPVIKNSAP